jgi:hypothetical protein
VWRALPPPLLVFSYVTLWAGFMARLLQALYAEGDL